MITSTSKYEVVAERTAASEGTILNIGARDRTLLAHLRSPNLRYLSADIAPGHDFSLDLESALPLADSAFEIVVAFDVLEHLENIHDAFREILRVARQRVFVSLPNMTSLSFRMRFMATGYLSGKYTLLPDHQGDRHRWLVSFHQARKFVREIAEDRGCSVLEYDILDDPRLYAKWRFVLPSSLLSPAVRTGTLLFEVSKGES